MFFSLHKIFAKSGPLSYGFLPQKQLILQIVHNFGEMKTLF